MVTPRLSIEPNYAVNWIDLLQGSFTTQLAGARATFTPTPLMFLRRLPAVQLERPFGLDQHPVPVGVSPRQRVLRRLQRGARHADAPFSRPEQPRAFIVKVNRLLRF